MTNIEWLAKMKDKREAFKQLACGCLRMQQGTCEGCIYFNVGKTCDAYTRGADDLARWLFKEHKEDEEEQNDDKA